MTLHICSACNCAFLVASLVMLSACTTPPKAPADFFPKAESAIRRIETRVPKNWKITQRKRNTAPTGIAGMDGGYYLKLTGPSPTYWAIRKNGVPVTQVYGKEEIELWIMPANFVVKKPGFIHAITLSLIPNYRAAEARCSDFKLFSEYTITPSWPNWGENLYRELHLQPVEF